MRAHGLLMLCLLPACAVTRAPSLNMLEVRADYDDKAQLDDALDTADALPLEPKRSEARVADIWIHPHELPTGDYFRGGWIRTLVEAPRWEINKSMQAQGKP